MRHWLFLGFGLAIALSSSRALGRSSGPATASTRMVSIGVNLHPLQWHYDTYSPAQMLGLAAGIGATVVRIDIHWEWFEYLRPGPASWNAPQLRDLDSFLAEAARRHLRVLATVVDTPCWASTQPGKQCPPVAP